MLNLKSARRFCIAMGLVCFVSIATCLFVLQCCRGVQTLPSPNTNNPEQITCDDDGFPVVDWEYWQSVNEDVIGWITIPDTDINYPILKAWPDNNDYYLKHNVYKDWDLMGAVHVDAECFDKELNSKNCVILGHSLNASGNGSIFTPLTQYADEGFAKSHQEILIQTPEWKKKVSWFGIQNINGSDAIKVTEFNNKNQFYSYQEDCYNNSDLKLEDKFKYKEQMFTLCTCSYFFNPSNERILIYVAE